MIPRVLITFFLLAMSLLCPVLASEKSGAVSRITRSRVAPPAEKQSPHTFIDNENGIVIIDLRRSRGHWTPAFSSSFCGDDSVALIDLSKAGHLITSESIRRSRGFNVIILDADPSIFTRHSVQCASASYLSRDYRTYLPIIQEIGDRFGLDPQLILTVIEVESGFNANAESPCGAMGLMQIMPETAKGLNLKNPYDPYENIVAGVKYLKQQLDRFGSIDLALAAYNAGPGAVEQHGGIPPYQETQQYVKIIMERYYGLPARP
jgi:hypothetical protein